MCFCESLPETSISVHLCCSFMCFIRVHFLCKYDAHCPWFHRAAYICHFRIGFVFCGISRLISLFGCAEKLLFTVQCKTVDCLICYKVTTWLKTWKCSGIWQLSGNVRTWMESLRIVGEKSFQGGKCLLLTSQSGLCRCLVVLCLDVYCTVEYVTATWVGYLEESGNCWGFSACLESGRRVISLLCVDCLNDHVMNSMYSMMCSSCDVWRHCCSWYNCATFVLFCCVISLRCNNIELLLQKLRLVFTVFGCNSGFVVLVEETCKQQTNVCLCLHHR